MGNCEDSTNAIICTKFKIQGYPTVISFKFDKEVNKDIPREEKDIIHYIHRLHAGKYKTKEELDKIKKKGPKSENPELYSDTHLPGLVHKITRKDFEEKVIKSDKN